MYVCKEKMRCETSDDVCLEHASYTYTHTPLFVVVVVVVFTFFSSFSYHT